jgi:hypothetical protein
LTSAGVRIMPHALMLAAVPWRSLRSRLGSSISSFVVGEGAVMMTLNAPRGKQGRLLDFAAQHGARNVRVFGSRACGEASTDSATSAC